MNDVHRSELYNRNVLTTSVIVTDEMSADAGRYIRRKFPDDPAAVEQLCSMLDVPCPNREDLELAAG